MLRNYILAAFRNLRRRKGYAALNVMGLAVGMACCLLIVRYVQGELSFDRHTPAADRVFRIVSDWGSFSVPATSPPVVRQLRADFPEIERMAMLNAYAPILRHDDRAFRENVIFTNPDVFDVFGFTLAQGSAADALARPNTLVLTADAARRYFGNADPIGQQLLMDNDLTLEVTGILKPIPPNTHFQTEFLVSFATLEVLLDFENSTCWGCNSLKTYLQLAPGVEPQAVEARLPAFVTRHAGANWNGATLSLQPLTDIHLHSHHNAELAPNSDIAYVYLFSAIAAFILLIAAINFVNLATARSAERAKEVGVRKVLGSSRQQLMRQFLAESVVLALMALALAVALASALLPSFRSLSGRALSLGLADPATMALLVGFAVGVGLLAGAFPALVLSGFRPVQVLKGRFQGSAWGVRLRKGLVVFQFAISVVLIIGTVAAYRQLGFLRSAQLGFDQEQVVVLTADDSSLVQEFPSFREQILAQPGVLDATMSSEGLPSELLDGDMYQFEGAANDSLRGLRTVAVGHHFFETLGASMAAGRAFSLDFPSDSGAVVLNEAAVRLLADDQPSGTLSADEAVGRTLDINGMASSPVIGVVQDFSMSTLREEVEPMAFRILPSRFDNFLVRIAPGQAAATVAALGAAWNVVHPDWPFEYTFADEAFGAAYRDEERLGRIFFAFAVLAIFVACLGLFGLAAYAAEQRRKEIGVRKVFGASVPGLVRLLAMDFLVLVGVSFLVALPVAYLGMERWLDDFAYRITLGPGIFLLAGSLAVGIALVTVSYHAIRAATADPVKSLRYE